MSHEDSHISDQQIVLELDGELSASEVKRVRAHLNECWKCRSRREELECAINGFVRSYQDSAKLPPIAGPRALLKARLAELSAAEPGRHAAWFSLSRNFGWITAALACCVLLLGLSWLKLGVRQNQFRPQPLIVSVPNSNLTPGAAVLFSQRAVCAQANVKNKAVPVALQRKVFDAYGIRPSGPGEYEVDYLITPALGGADDIHNLWPQSHTDTVWNAEVKDALEDRLRDMVCDGKLDLEEAQRQIASNWIDAYKKYFHTDQPLPAGGRSFLP